MEQEKKSYLEEFLTTQGTIGPVRYWLRVIATLVVAGILGFCAWVYLSSIGSEDPHHAGTFIPLAIFIILVITIFSTGILLAQAIRRLRDAQVRPFWSALLIVPGVNLLTLVLFGLLPRRAAARS